MKFHNKKLEFTKNTQELLKKKLEVKRPEKAVINQSRFSNSIKIHLSDSKHQSGRSPLKGENFLMESIFLDSSSSELSSPLYSDSYPDSPTVRGYRSQTKKLKEEKEFLSFLQKQEEVFIEQRERANSHIFLTPSTKNPAYNRRRLSTADPDTLKNNLISIGSVSRDEEIKRKGREICEISPSPRKEIPLRVRKFEIGVTLTELKRKFSQEEDQSQ